MYILYICYHCYYLLLMFIYSLALNKNSRSNRLWLCPSTGERDIQSFRLSAVRWAQWNGDVVSLCQWVWHLLHHVAGSDHVVGHSQRKLQFKLYVKLDP